MITNPYQRRIVEKRLSEGRCRNCGKPLDREGTRCIECRKKVNKVLAERRHWYQDNGICPRCGKNSIGKDEKNCPECRARNTSNERKRREKDKEGYNRRQRDYSKKRIAEADMTTCTRCFKPKSDDGFRTCPRCRDKGREASRIRRGVSRSYRGICRFCDSPTYKNYKVCEMHYNRLVNIANLPQAQEARIKNKSRYDF